MFLMRCLETRQSSLRRGKVGPCCSLELILSVADLPYSKPCHIFCFSCSCFSSWILELQPTPVSTILLLQFYLSYLMWLCSTDCFTALLHNSTISSAALAKVMELGCPRPELNHGEGGGVTEGATGCYRASGLQWPSCTVSKVDLGPETLNLLSLAWNRSHYSSSTLLPLTSLQGPLMTSVVSWSHEKDSKTHFYH